MILLSQRQEVSALSSVFLAEFAHSSSGINDFLFTCVEGVTSGADLHVKLSAHGRLGCKTVATGADHLGLTVVRMDPGFHDIFLLILGSDACDPLRVILHRGAE